MATYVNNLRLKEIATGAESGTWGTSTNTNLELIGEGLGFATVNIASDGDATETVADGSADNARAMYIKVTSTTLTATRTLTIAPNTIKRVHIIENASTGSQDITIKQGSGSTVTIPNGKTKVVYLDGAGSGGAVVDAFTHLSTTDLSVEDDLSLTSDSSVINMGAGNDVTFTHDGTTGLTIAATPISIDATGELHLNSTTGDIKLQDGGTDQIAFDLDGTAGEVIMKPAVDSDDLVISQYDGTEVIRIEDNASLGLVGNKLNIADSSSDVVIKPLTDAKDIIFQQYDGTAVMTVEDNVSLAINNDVTVAGRGTGTQTTDNDGDFDLSVSNFFKCTPSGNITLTFSNPAEGQSGTVMLINTGGHTISAHASVAINADVLTALTVAGTYMLNYYCSASSGANTILVGATGALT